MFDKLFFSFQIVWVVSQVLMVKKNMGIDQEDDACLDKACYKWETVHSFVRVHCYLSAPVRVWNIGGVAIFLVGGSSGKTKIA